MKSIYLRNFVAIAALVAICFLLVALSFVGVGRQYVISENSKNMDRSAEEIAHIAGAKTVMLFTDYDYGRAAPKDKPNVASLHGAQITDIPVEDVRAALAKFLG